jgi:hypothetical protein
MRTCGEITDPRHPRAPRAEGGVSEDADRNISD